jgi:lysozyme family protein
MADIDSMIDDILRREGGYVDHAADRGGATKYGVTQQTLAEYLGRAVTKDDVRNMDIELAREIYRKNYYYGPKIDRLPEPIQPFIFDWSINHGPVRAIKFVQQVCNAAGIADLIGVDGRMGPATERAAAATQNSLGSGFLNELIEERRHFYRDIVERDPSQEIFLAGWMNRVNEFSENLA